jgi:NDP-sugar pyrophosphorylase family protein
MDALILAAGEGTRLLPLTRIRPKPLFPILNRPLLENTFNYLSRFSIQRTILNTHHLATQIEHFIRTQKKYWPFGIETRFEPEILNTGGGIGNTRDFWRSDPFVVINSDILTDIDLQKAVDFHQNHHGPVTLILHDYPEFNNILVDRQGRIQELRQKKGSGLAFTGIYLLNREIFNFLPASGNYDIIPIYQQMIKEGIPVWAHVSQGHYWRDIGTSASYLKVHEELLSGDSNLENSIPFPPPFVKGGLGGIFSHPEARIEEGVEFSGWACIGKGCLLKKGCRIHNCVLWEEVTVESGASVSESILGKGVHLKNDLQSGVLV